MGSNPTSSAIAADFLNKKKAFGEFVENEGCSVAIMNARRADFRLEKHTQRVDQNMALAALDGLARIITDIPACVRPGLDRLAAYYGKRWLLFTAPGAASDGRALHECAAMSRLGKTV